MGGGLGKSGARRNRLSRGIEHGFLGEKKREAKGEMVKGGGK